MTMQPPDVILRERFSVLSFSISTWHEAPKTLRRLRCTSDWLDGLRMEAFLEAVRDAVPADACLISVNGEICHWVTIHRVSVLSFDLVFSSSTWPSLQNGDCLPEMQILFDRAPPPVDPPTISIHSLNLIGESDVEIVLNKHERSVDIPKSRETEDQLVIVIKPK